MRHATCTVWKRKTWNVSTRLLTKHVLYKTLTVKTRYPSHVMKTGTLTCNTLKRITCFLFLECDALLRDVLEGRMTGKRTRGRKRLQLMSNICEGYETAKKRAEDRCLWCVSVMGVIDLLLQQNTRRRRRRHEWSKESQNAKTVHGNSTVFHEHRSIYCCCEYIFCCAWRSGTSFNKQKCSASSNLHQRGADFLLDKYITWNCQRCGWHSTKVYMLRITFLSHVYCLKGALYLKLNLIASFVFLTIKSCIKSVFGFDWVTYGQQKVSLIEF